MILDAEDAARPQGAIDRRGRDEGHPFGAAHSPPRVMASLDIANLLQQLPKRQRLPIQYVKIEGGSIADAAKRTGYHGISSENPPASIRAFECGPP
jgi:DNA-directed RNA polymerase specialized sigma24 family protein